MYSAKNATTNSNECEQNCESNQKIIFYIGKNRDDKGSRKKCMPRRKRIVCRMRNNGRDICTIKERMWMFAPLWNAEIHNRINHKNRYNESKNLQCASFVFIIFLECSVEPSAHQKNRTPYNDAFCQNCYQKRIF